MHFWSWCVDIWKPIPYSLVQETGRKDVVIAHGVLKIVNLLNNMECFGALRKENFRVQLVWQRLRTKVDNKLYFDLSNWLGTAGGL